MKDALTSSPPKSFWIVSGVAFTWNLLGIAAYLMHVTMSPEALAGMNEAERTLYTSAPSWVTGAYAIAVFGGALGCVGLLLRKTWAMAVFVISLIGILAQMGYSLLVQNTIEVMGPTIVIMPLAVIVIGIYLIWFAKQSRAAGYLT